MTIRSLRLRLLLGGGIAILAALALAWYAMVTLFTAQIHARESEQLGNQMLPLIAGLSLNAQQKPIVSVSPSDSRFQRPSGGLYWQVRAPGGTARSRSLWDQDLPPMAPAKDHAWHARLVVGPFEPQVLLLERHLILAGNRDVTIQIAEDTASLTQARAQFVQDTRLYIILLWLLLSAAAALQVHLGLKPLRRLQNALKTLRHNPSQRLAVADHPLEVAPLLQAINELAEAREQDVKRARRRAADLAHGLKTPLAVLRAQSQKLRGLDDGAIVENLDKAIAAAAAAIEAELARARAAAARENAPPVAAIRPVAERVVSVVERTEAGAALVFEIECPADITLPASDEELAEILGSLTENAARFARRRVRITADHRGGQVRLAVEDDGPGLANWQLEEALIRGRRLDETGSGHGLGLAIARDLVEARGGAVVLLRSDLGGLKVEITWGRES